MKADQKKKKEFLFNNLLLFDCWVFWGEMQHLILSCSSELMAWTNIKQNAAQTNE